MFAAMHCDFGLAKLIVSVSRNLGRAQVSQSATDHAEGAADLVEAYQEVYSS
jgi:hypothetical protein